MMICKTFLMKSAGAKKDLFFSNSEEELFQEVNMIVPTILRRKSLVSIYVFS